MRSPADIVDDVMGGKLRYGPAVKAIHTLLYEERLRMAKLICKACEEGDSPSSTDLGMYHVIGFFDRREVRCPAERIHGEILCRLIP